MYTAVYASAKGDISARNLPDGDPFIISQKASFEWMPDISHNRVVWWESGGRVMLRDLKTKRHARSSHYGSRPRIDGELVDVGRRRPRRRVRHLLRRRRQDLRAQRGPQHQRPVTFGVAKQTNLFPAISGHRVVWEAGPARRVLSHIHIYGARVK